jgi:hypothetical protein
LRKRKGYGKIHTQKMHSGLLKNIGNLMIQQHLS